MTELARKPVDAGRADPFLRLVEAVATRHQSADDAMGDERYRAFLEALGVAVYTTDANGAITYFNEAAAELWGRRPALGEE
jgi:PAS domain-containing protein